MDERYRLEKEIEWVDAQQDRLEFECSLYRLDDVKAWVGNEPTRLILLEEIKSRMGVLMCQRIELDRKLGKLPQPESKPNPYDGFFPRPQNVRQFFPVEPGEEPVSYTQTTERYYYWVQEDVVAPGTRYARTKTNEPPEPNADWLRILSIPPGVDVVHVNVLGKLVTVKPDKTS